MNREDIRTLWGTILLLAGVFAPWHAFSYGYPFPRVAPEIAQGTITGWNLAGGKGIILLGVLIAALTLFPHRTELGTRVLTARLFAAHAAGVLLLITGIVPALFTWNVDPHVGLGFTLFGYLLIFTASRRALRPHPGRRATN